MHSDLPSSPATRSSSPSLLSASAYPRKKKGSLWTSTSSHQTLSISATECKPHHPSVPDLGCFPTLFAFFQAELAALSSSVSNSIPSSTPITPSKLHRHILRDSTSRQNILAFGSGCAESPTPDRDQQREKLARRKRQKSSKKDSKVFTEDELRLQEVDWKVLAAKEDIVLSDSPTLVVLDDEKSPLYQSASPLKPIIAPLHHPLLASITSSPPRPHSPPPPSSLRRLATKLIRSFPHDELSIAKQVLAEDALAETFDYDLPSTAVLYPLQSLDLDPPMNPENGVHIFVDQYVPAQPFTPSTSDADPLFPIS